MNRDDSFEQFYYYSNIHLAVAVVVLLYIFIVIQINYFSTSRLCFLLLNEKIKIFFFEK